MVFSKKNVSIDGVYEFSDGTKAEFKVKPLTTAEQVSLDEMRKTDATIKESVDFIGCSIRMLMMCDDTLKDRIIDDVYNNSDLVEFREALIGAVMSAKEKVENLIEYIRFSKNRDNYNPINLDNEEVLIIQCFQTPLYGTGFGAEINFGYIKEFCKTNKLNIVDVYQVCKVLLYEFIKE